MSLRIHSLGLAVILAGALAPAAPGSARAAAANGRAPEVASASLQSERRKLVVDLARANAEIEQLKKKDRGVRDDYRLRTRMADAEAMARRLTEIDAQLGGPVQPAGPTPPRPAMPAVESTPADGPAEWEARADILTDQSRKLEAQATALSQRVAGLRSRVELRRRASQLEADPFAPMEGSKRRLIATLPSSAPTSGLPGSGDSTKASTEPTTPGANRGSGTGVAAPGGGGASSPPPMTQGATPLAGQTASGSTPPAAGPTESGPVSVATNPRSSAPTPLSPSAGGPGAGADNASALSAQLRDYLDPGALATIRKLEAAGTPNASVEAMERAAAALRERAQRLQAQSNGLRERAKSAR